jgi:tape measure domain-containing protein
MATVGAFNVALVASTGRFVSAISKADRRWNNFARNIQRQSRSMPEAIRKVTPAALTMARVVTRATAVAGAALTGMGAVGVKMAANFEQSQIAFTTLLGSAEEASRFLRELEIQARRTPFGMAELQQASRQLLAYGFTADRVLEMITPIGDAVAAMGGGSQMFESVIRALGQIRAKGKLASQEMLQLTEQGIPAWEFLAEAIGVTVPEAMEKVSKGAVSSTVAIDAVLRGMIRKFGGAMEAQSRTMLGQWEQLRDGMATITRGLGQDIIRIFGLASAMERLNNAIGRFADMVSREGFLGALRRAFPPWVQPIIIGIAGAIGGALVPVIVGMLIPALKKLRTSLVATMRPLLPWMVIGAAVAATALLIARYWNQLGDIARRVWSGISAVVLYAASLIVRGTGAIIGAISVFIPALRGASQAMTDMANRLKSMAAQSMAAAKTSASGSTAVAQSAQQVATTAQKAAEAQQGLGESVEEAAKAAQSNLQSFDEVHSIQEEMADSPATLELEGLEIGDLPGVAGLGNVFADLAEEVDAGAGRIAQAWQKTVDAISGAWERLKTGALNTFPWLQSVIDGFARAADWVRANWSTIGPVMETVAGVLAVVGLAILAITSPIGAVVAAATILVTIATLIIANWDEVGAFLRGLWEKLGPHLISIWETLKDAAVALWEAIVETAKVIWNGLKTFWANWGDTILALLGGVWRQIGIIIETAINLVKNIIGLVLALIRGDWEAAWNHVKAIGQTVWNFLVVTWENIKTTVVAVWQSIKDNIQAAWTWIQNVTKAIWNAIVGWLTGLWEGIRSAISNTWQNIRDTISERWSNIKTNTETIWSKTKQWLSNTWDAISSTASTTWGWIRDRISAQAKENTAQIEASWNKLSDILSRIWERIRDLAGQIWDGIVSRIKSAVNVIIGAINKFIDGLNSLKITVPEINIPFVGTVGGFTIGLPPIPKIPMLARGAQVFGPTLAMIGEGTRPEAVVPLPPGVRDLGDMVPSEESLARAIYQAFVTALRVTQSSGAQSGADREIVLKVGTREFARAILPEIIAEGQRQGLQLVVRPQGV